MAFHLDWWISYSFLMYEVCWGTFTGKGWCIVIVGEPCLMSGIVMLTPHQPNWWCEMTIVLFAEKRWRQPKNLLVDTFFMYIVFIHGFNIMCRNLLVPRVVDRFHHQQQQVLRHDPHVHIHTFFFLHYPICNTIASSSSSHFPTHSLTHTHVCLHLIPYPIIAWCFHFQST